MDDKRLLDIQVLDLLPESSRNFDDAEQEHNTNIAVKAFKVFDHELDDTIDIEDFGHVIRSIEICVTEKHIDEILKQVPQMSGKLHLDEYVPVATDMLKNIELYQLPTKEKLLEAFRVIDFDKSNAIPLEKLKELLSNHGEPLSEQEIQGFLSTCGKNYIENDDVDYGNYAIFLHDSAKEEIFQKESEKNNEEEIRLEMPCMIDYNYA